jgi:ParB family chromosome partitioning protein
MLRSGRLSAGQAKPLLAVEGEERQVALAERALAQGLTARDLEGLGRESGGSRRRRARAAEPHAQEAADRLTRRLQTRVEITRRGGKKKGGQIRIHFHGEEELMRLYDHLMAKGPRR